MTRHIPQRERSLLAEVVAPNSVRIRPSLARVVRLDREPGMVATEMRRAPVGEHSAKPDKAYERIERLLAGPYLELFARAERTGWTTWGNELVRGCHEH